MTDKRTTPEAGAGRSKRVAPTIDLTATEVPPAATAGEPPPPETAEQMQAVPEQEQSSSEIPKESLNRPSANFNGLTLAAGATGAAIMTLVLCGLWLSGLLPVREPASTVLPAVDTKSIDAFNDRIAKIEGAIAKIPAGDTNVSERIAATDNAMKSLGLALAALNRRSDDVAANAALARERVEAVEKAVTELRTGIQDAARNTSGGISSAELDALQKRIAGLEQSAKAAAMSTTIDMPARLTLSAAALRDAAVSGTPLAASLMQLKSLGASENALAPLEPFAASGVPTPAALAQELRALLPAMLKLSGAQAPDGGFLDRLQANAGKLVRIRPVDAPPGDDVSVVLARLEIEAAHNDIAGALTDFGKLPDVARAPAQAWIKKANERQAALAAARALAVETARALGKQ